MDELIKFCKKMESKNPGNINFYTVENHNGFKQGILELKENNAIVSVWMSSNMDETNFLSKKFGK